MSHESIGLELEAELFSKDSANEQETSDPVEKFFDAEDFGGARTDDTLYRKRFDRPAFGGGAAPRATAQADPVAEEEQFQKAFAEVAAEIRRKIATGDWHTFVKATAKANPERVKEARAELVGALRDTQ